MKKRQLLRLTDLAKATGISTSFLCEIMLNKKRPSVFSAIKLEEATGVKWTKWLRPELGNPYIKTNNGDD